MTPAARDLTADERNELREVYLRTPPLHHLTFDQCLVDTAIRICLWNVAMGRRKALARRKAAEEIFRLTPL